MQETWSLQKNALNSRIRSTCHGPHVPPGDSDAGWAHSPSSQLSEHRLETQQYLGASLAWRNSNKPNMSLPWGQSGLCPEWDRQVHLRHSFTGEPFKEEMTAERVEQNSNLQETIMSEQGFHLPVDVPRAQTRACGRNTWKPLQVSAATGRES